MKNETERESIDCPVPKGILLIIGGKEEKLLEEETKVDDDHEDERLEVLRAFVKLIDKEDPLIQVVTTATSEPEETIADYRKVFSKLGVHRIEQIHHTRREETDDRSLAEKVKHADAIFFSGGDQLLLTSLYGGTAFLTEMKQRYIHERIVVAGTSAGAMAMSTPMIYAGSKEVQQITGEVKMATGLEFLKDVCIDTHFIDRSRFIRMAQVIALNPACIGVGIEEDTAVIVTEGLNAEIIGTGIVTVIEGFHISESNVMHPENKPVMIKDLRVHLLNKGSKYRIPQSNPPHK